MFQQLLVTITVTGVTVTAACGMSGNSILYTLHASLTKSLIELAGIILSLPVEDELGITVAQVGVPHVCYAAWKIHF
jgi:hypothetical protein